MRYILLTCLLMFFVTSASAVDPVIKSINIKVNIFKNTNTGKLSIEADKDVYPALYSAENQRFDDLEMGFTVSSPASNTQDYEIEVVGSEHQCDSTSTDVDSILFAVDILFDGAPLENDLTDTLLFQRTDNDVRSSQHRFTLLYPELLQTDSGQVCSGMLQVFARLII